MNGEDNLMDAGFALGDLTRALLIMKTMNGHKPVSVHHAAEVFNVTPGFLRGALREGAGLFLAGPDETPGTQFIEIGT